MSAGATAPATPTVTSFTPTTVSSGTTVTITGTGLANATAVNFGFVPGTILTDSGTVITATVPTGDLLGSADTDVTTVGWDTSVIPLVTVNSANLLAPTFTINGYGFDATSPSNNSVSFSDGAIGTVTTATPTTLTVTFTSGPINIGVLNAVVTTDWVNVSASAQVATVIPVVLPSTANLGATATSMTIAGFGFGTTAANDSVSFNNSVTGSVSGA